MLEQEEFTGPVIGAAIEVHKTLGPGYLEKVYQLALEIELATRGIPFERQQKVPVFYRDHQVAEHQLDLVAYGEIVVELKAVKHVEDAHFAVAGPISARSVNSTASS